MPVAVSSLTVAKLTTYQNWEKRVLKHFSKMSKVIRNYHIQYLAFFSHTSQQTHLEQETKQQQNST